MNISFSYQHMESNVHVSKFPSSCFEILLAEFLALLLPNDSYFLFNSSFQPHYPNRNEYRRSSLCARRGGGGGCCIGLADCLKILGASTTSWGPRVYLGLYRESFTSYMTLASTVRLSRLLPKTLT
jgi:hypothetical protein